MHPRNPRNARNMAQPPTPNAEVVNRGYRRRCLAKGRYEPYDTYNPYESYEPYGSYDPYAPQGTLGNRGTLKNCRCNRALGIIGTLGAIVAL